MKIKDSFAMRCTKRISLVLILLLGIISAITPVMAAPYVIENVKIDVTAKNALEARDSAFEKAQVKAFEALGQKLVQSGEISKFNTPSSQKISSMLRDFEIKKEKVSAVRYVGLYTFRFSETAVKKYFGIYKAAPNQDELYADGTPYRQGATAAPYSVPKVLIVPFMKQENGSFIFNDKQNTWLSAWQARDTLRTGFVAPSQNDNTLGTVNTADGFSYDPQDMETLIKKYNADIAMLAIASKNTAGNHIDLYDTTGAEPQFIRRITVSGLEFARADEREIWLSATRRVENSIAGDLASNRYASNRVQTSNTQYQPTSYNRGKEEYTRPYRPNNASAGGATLTQVSFSSLQEWASIYKSLRNNRAVNQVVLKSLSPKFANVALYHTGSIQNLIDGMAQSGLSLSKSTANNMYILRKR